jgi:hypothetical protein
MNPTKTNRAEQAETVDRSIQRFQTEREALWHALAVQHQQRALILDGLQSINAKLKILVDAVLRNESSLNFSSFREQTALRRKRHLERCNQKAALTIT